MGNGASSGVLKENLYVTQSPTSNKTGRPYDFITRRSRNNHAADHLKTAGSNMPMAKSVAGNQNLFFPSNPSEPLRRSQRRSQRRNYRSVQRAAIGARLNDNSDSSDSPQLNLPSKAYPPTIPDSTIHRTNQTVKINLLQESKESHKTHSKRPSSTSTSVTSSRIKPNGSSLIRKFSKSNAKTSEYNTENIQPTINERLYQSLPRKHTWSLNKLKDRDLADDDANNNSKKRSSSPSAVSGYSTALTTISSPLPNIGPNSIVNYPHKPDIRKSLKLRSQSQFSSASVKSASSHRSLVRFEEPLVDQTRKLRSESTESKDSVFTGVTDSKPAESETSNTLKSKLRRKYSLFRIKRTKSTPQCTQIQANQSYDKENPLSSNAKPTSMLILNKPENRVGMDNTIIIKSPPLYAFLLGNNPNLPKTDFNSEDTTKQSQESVISDKLIERIRLGSTQSAEEIDLQPVSKTIALRSRESSLSGTMELSSIPKIFTEIDLTERSEIKEETDEVKIVPETEILPLSQCLPTIHNIPPSTLPKPKVKPHIPVRSNFSPPVTTSRQKVVLQTSAFMTVTPKSETNDNNICVSPSTDSSVSNTNSEHKPQLSPRVSDTRSVSQRLKKLSHLETPSHYPSNIPIPIPIPKHPRQSSQRNIPPSITTTSNQIQNITPPFIANNAFNNIDTSNMRNISDPHSTISSKSPASSYSSQRNPITQTSSSSIPIRKSNHDTNHQVPSTGGKVPSSMNSLYSSQTKQLPIFKPSLPLTGEAPENLSSIFGMNNAISFSYPIDDKNAVLMRLLRRFLAQSLPISQPVLGSLCSAGLLSLRSADSALLRPEGNSRIRHVLDRMHFTRNGLAHFSRDLARLVELRSLNVPKQFLESVADLISCLVELVDLLVEEPIRVDYDFQATEDPDVDSNEISLNTYGSLPRASKIKRVDTTYKTTTVVRSSSIKTSSITGSLPRKGPLTAGTLFGVEIVYRDRNLSSNTVLRSPEFDNYEYKTETSAKTYGVPIERLSPGFRMCDSDHASTYTAAIGLELGGMRLPDLFWNQLGKLCAKYNNIVGISLAGCNVNLSNISSLLHQNSIGSAPSLLLLNLRLNNCLSEFGKQSAMLSPTVPILHPSVLPSLRYLCLACCSLDAATALPILLPLLQRLNGIDLSYNDLSVTPVCLFQRLCTLPRLKLLRLRNTALTSEQLDLVFESLSNSFPNNSNMHRKLETLDVSGNVLNKFNINSLATGLAGCNSLIELSLEQTNIVADDCSLLSKAMLMNRSLVAFDLSGNPLEDEGAEHLATVVRRKLTLKEIVLNRCSLGLPGVEAILQASAESTSKVVYIRLAGNAPFTRVQFEDNLKHQLQRLNTLNKSVVI